jgi:hypothetical protein
VIHWRAMAVFHSRPPLAPIPPRVRKPATYSEARSASGSSLMMFSPEGLRRAARTVKAPEPTAADRLDEKTCLRCGFPGRHVDAYDCIDGLRDRLAMLEQRRESPRR